VCTCLIVVNAAMPAEIPNATMKAIRALPSSRDGFPPSAHVTAGGFPHPANPVRPPEPSMPAPYAHSACMPAGPRLAPQAAGNYLRALEKCLTASWKRGGNELRNLNEGLRDLNAAGTYGALLGMGFCGPARESTIYAKFPPHVEPCAHPCVD
jgi:hypothetical protein